LLAKNVFITGFMGTGKSTVGKYLAKKTGKIFLDTDYLIESREGKSINEIFLTYGENHFRNLENNILKEVCIRKDVIVATGGGTLLSEKNYQLAYLKGIIILLWATPEVIVERLSREGDRRPLLFGAGKLEKVSLLINQRKESYNRFEYRIDTSNLAIEEVANRIIKLWGGLFACENHRN
jgi:shikimate kinase